MIRKTVAYSSKQYEEYEPLKREYLKNNKHPTPEQYSVEMARISIKVGI